MKSNRLMIIMAVILLAVLGASLLHEPMSSVKAVTDAPRYGGTLVKAITSDPSMFVNAVQMNHVVGDASGLTENSLIQWSLDGQPVPDLAESWEISPDGLTYTFHLVKNATWHDGVPFTSADVKFSIENVLLKYNPRRVVIYPAFDHVDTPDPYTAIIKMRYAYAPFMSYISNNWTPMVAKHLYEGTDILNNPYNWKPVGTGPFKFQEYVKGDHVTYVKNQNYFKKGKPYLDKIILKISPDQTSMMSAFERGETDYIDFGAFPNSAVDAVSKLPGVTFIKVTILQLDINVVDLNIRKPPLNDVRVRQAINYAIDKQQALTSAFYGLGNLATGPIQSAVKWAYNANVSRYDYNPAKANALLDQAGYPKKADGMRFTISMTYRREVPAHGKLAEILRAQLKDVGIDLTMKQMDASSALPAVANWDYEMFPYTQSTGPDPAQGTQYMYSKNIQHTPFTNTGGYNNTEYDSLYEKARQEPNRDLRAQYYYKIQEIAMRDVPYIWLVNVLYPYVFKSTLVGFPEGGIGSENMEKVYLTTGSDLAPQAIQSKIQNAQKTLESLRAQYYDVSAASKQLEQAQKALDAGDYMNANQLADGALKLVQPPYILYGAVVAVIAIAIAGAILYRKRRPKKS